MGRKHPPLLSRCFRILGTPSGLPPVKWQTRLYPACSSWSNESWVRLSFPLIKSASLCLMRAARLDESWFWAHSRWSMWSMAMFALGWMKTALRVTATSCLLDKLCMLNVTKTLLLPVWSLRHQMLVAALAAVTKVDCTVRFALFCVTEQICLLLYRRRYRHYHPNHRGETKRGSINNRYHHIWLLCLANKQLFSLEYACSASIARCFYCLPSIRWGIGLSCHSWW